MLLCAPCFSTPPLPRPCFRGRRPPPDGVESLPARIITFLLVLLAAAGSTAGAAELSDAIEAKSERGIATFYSSAFEGRRTASGKIFRNDELMAAHGSHPFGTLVRVTNLDHGSSVDVRIADRGGFAKRRAGSVIIDLSQAAAERLSMLRRGRARVLVEVLEWGERKGEALRNAIHKAVPSE